MHWQEVLQHMQKIAGNASASAVYTSTMSWHPPGNDTNDGLERCILLLLLLFGHMLLPTLSSLTCHTLLGVLAVML
jgi:hypothetical protein